MRSVARQSVCVIGGAGFLGSHLVRYLLELDCRVLVIDNLVVGRRDWVPNEATFYHHDITTSEEHLHNVLYKNKVKFLFNYAAYPYVPDSVHRPLHVFEVNATGAMKVINAAHEAGCEAILQVSSAELYGDGFGAISEEAAVVPHSSYGASKAAVDAYVQCRWKEARVPCIALRQFNCVGERETHPYVLPEIIGQVHHGEGTVLLGNNSRRDFMYAGDAVRMAVELLERGQFGEVYNLGSEQSIRIYELARLVGEVMGKEVTVEPDASRVRPWEIWHLQSDNTKIHGAITSRPQVQLREAIELTVKHYLACGRWVWE